MSYSVVSNKELLSWMRMLYPVELNEMIVQVKVHLDYVKSKSFMKVRYYGEAKKGKIGKIQNKVIKLNDEAVDKIYKKLQSKMHLPKFVNQITFNITKEEVPEFEIKMIPLIREN